MIERSFTLYSEPTPEELAEEFWGMSEVEQARFFNRLGEITISGELAFQLQAVTTSSALNTEGRRAMELIGDYS